MDVNKFKHWPSALQSKEKRPAYLMIPDIIAEDVDKGVLKACDRLPTVRELAEFLSLNYTTIVRAYKEASHRGLIESHPGSGSYVKGKAKTLPLQGGSNFEMTMNSPPEPQQSALVNRLKSGVQALGEHHDIQSMMRYQDFGGLQQDKEAGAQFLNPLIEQPNTDQLLVCPGIHSALVALMSVLAGNNATVCVQGLVYPGLKAIAAQLGIKLVSVSSDHDGPQIRALEALCQKGDIKAIYVNPTLQNPSTQTFSNNRREAIAELALHYSIPIIEDDPYALILNDVMPPIASYAPQLTYYISGLSKCFGAGMRTAYLYAPSKLLAQRLAGALRALSVMASPVTNALATHWILDGTVETVIQAIKKETAERQVMARQYLDSYMLNNHPASFHLWLRMPKDMQINPSTLAAHLRSNGINAVSSAAFCTDNNPPDAIRVGLGGAKTREQCEESLKLLADIFEHPSHLSSIVL